jgi:hypothetical protein
VQWMGKPDPVRLVNQFPLVTDGVLLGSAVPCIELCEAVPVDRTFSFFKVLQWHAAGPAAPPCTLPGVRLGGLGVVLPWVLYYVPIFDVIDEH